MIDRSSHPIIFLCRVGKSSGSLMRERSVILVQGRLQLLIEACNSSVNLCVKCKIRGEVSPGNLRRFWFLELFHSAWSMSSSSLNLSSMRHTLANISKSPILMKFDGINIIFEKIFDAYFFYRQLSMLKRWNISSNISEVTKDTVFA